MFYDNKELLLRANLSLSFKDNVVLRGVSFEIYNTVQPESSIPRGQVVAILGPSGIGKTQLFRCIAGLQIPTEGAIYIDGNNEPVNEGEVGVVAQDYPLIETRTVMGNLVRAFQVARRRKKNKPSGFREHVVLLLGDIFQSLKDCVVDDKEAKTSAIEYLRRFKLTGITNHYPCQLSGGQRQRVAIIQQMMCSKHYLLMDEPFSGLDIIAKDDASELIAEMASADELNTIILTTHDIRTACASADRIILLGREHDSEGKIIPGAYVVADYDLKGMDLCWISGITETEKFKQFVSEIEKQFRNL